VRVQADGSAEVLASGLAYPSTVGSYPTYSSPATGFAVIIRVDSPVDVLLTAPDGRQIGVDPQTGLPVNDFGENGFDSGPGEPRFFGIHDSAPGDWDVELIGTGNGPFAINVYGIDLDEPVGHRARMTGTAALGARAGAFFRLDAAADVEIFPRADFDDDGDVDGDDLVKWQADFGPTGGSDVDNDGDSDGADFLAWQRQLSGAAATTPAEAVPEPVAALLAAFALATVAFTRSLRPQS
jgi:hypothetical protein